MLALPARTSARPPAKSSERTSPPSRTGWSGSVANRPASATTSSRFVSDHHPALTLPSVVDGRGEQATHPVLEAELDAVLIPHATCRGSAACRTSVERPHPELHGLVQTVRAEHHETVQGQVGVERENLDPPTERPAGVDGPVVRLDSAQGLLEVSVHGDLQRMEELRLTGVVDAVDGGWSAKGNF